MSISGNNHSSGNSGSRTSIFEAFHTPSFGDDNFEVQPQPIIIQPIRTYTRQPVVAQGVLTLNSQTGSSSSLQSLSREEVSKTEEEEIFDEDEDSSGENAVTTLWMSCSPGRDFTDEEEEEEVAPSQEEEEDEGDEMQSESSDDGLPLSKLAGKRFLEKGLKPPSAKRIKQVKPLKIRKDKKGPKKPLSAYAFFYRDTQMAIKSQNPQATFGEISKIVASMWDRLDGELKEDYNKRAEENKKEYIKQLAEYCALNKDKIPSSAKSKQKKPKKPSSSSKPKHKPMETDSPSESQDRVAEESDPKDETDNMETSRRSSESSERMMSPKQDEKQEKPRPICNYTKCQNPAIDDPRWENNYCSSECVILHCKDVFNAWVANRKSAYCETLYVNWRFMRGIEAQFLALQKGFSELISPHLMHPFDERELELVISGLGKIDVEDWKKNTWLENCTLDTNIVKWFWRAVEEFDEERRARLLQFVTGSSRVPLQGFKALQGSTGSQGPRLFTIHQVDTNTDSLPEAHTCFNRIDIPPYESYTKFLDKLTCAVEETCGFAIE